MMLRKKSQIWIETVIYTLIGLTILAIVLSIAIPQIEKIKDREVIKQTTIALNVLNSKISSVEESRGSIGIVEFKIAKGRFEINADTNQIIYVLENTGLELSEVGGKVQEGDIFIETKKYGSKYNIFLSLNYSNSLNITNKLEKNTKTLQPSSSSYKIQIENLGFDEASQLINIDFNVY